MLCFVALKSFLLKVFIKVIIILNVFSNVFIWFLVIIFINKSLYIFSVRSCKGGQNSALIHFYCQTGGIFTSQQDYIDLIFF